MWRLLEEGELIKDGDEIFVGYHIPWEKVGYIIGAEKEKLPIIRRKIEENPDSSQKLNLTSKKNKISEIKTIEDSQEFLIKFMKESFGDRTFSKYINNRLAVDFAFELAVAIEKKLSSLASERVSFAPDVTLLMCKLHDECPATMKGHVGCFDSVGCYRS